MSNMYVVCSHKGAVVRIDGISIQGRESSMPAIFLEEQDALEFLYKIESDLGIQGHRVDKVDAMFTAQKG